MLARNLCCSVLLLSRPVAAVEEEGAKVDVNGRSGRQRGTALGAGSEGEGESEARMRDEMEQWVCR
jgi:hypothetical protein